MNYEDEAETSIPIESLTLEMVWERMGYFASREEAEEMKKLVLATPYRFLDDITDVEWFSMIAVGVIQGG